MAVPLSNSWWQYSTKQVYQEEGCWLPNTHVKLHDGKYLKKSVFQMFSGKKRLGLTHLSTEKEASYLQKNLIISINQQRLHLRAFSPHFYDLGIWRRFLINYVGTKLPYDGDTSHWILLSTKTQEKGIPPWKRNRCWPVLSVADLKHTGNLV